MRLQDIFTFGLLASCSYAVPASLESDEAAVKQIAEEAKSKVLDQLDQQAAKLRARGEGVSCKRENLVFRRE